MTAPEREQGLIGVLGGMSWPSTILTYRYLNETVEARLGGRRSARIVLYSIDYHPIKSCYYEPEGWSKIPNLLRREIDRLLAFRPDCWMLANNTLHKAYDQLENALPSSPPIFHAPRLVCDHVGARGFSKVLLLGTQFTVTDGFYAQPMIAAGVQVEIPSSANQDRLQEIQDALAHGRTDPTFTDWFAALIAAHAETGCQAVVLACTELPLAIDPQRSPIPVVDPLRLQCQACVDYALSRGAQAESGSAVSSR